MSKEKQELIVKRNAVDPKRFHPWCAKAETFALNVIERGKSM
jgi:hypothetical protein